MRKQSSLGLSSPSSAMFPLSCLICHLYLPSLIPPSSLLSFTHLLIINLSSPICHLCLPLSSFVSHLSSPISHLPSLISHPPSLISHLSSHLSDGNLGVRDVVVVDARRVGEDRLSPLLHIVEVQHHLCAQQPSDGRSLVGGQWSST